MLRYRSLLSWQLLFIFALLSTSCKPWQVIRQTNPNPFSPSSKFILAPLTFQHLRIGKYSRDEYMQRKKPADQQKWNTIMGDMQRLFATHLRIKASGVNIIGGSPSANGFIIQANIHFIDPGVNAVVFRRNSLVQIKVRILRGGTILDEVLLESKTTPSLIKYPSIASRLRRDSKILGRWAGKYIKTRIVKK